MSSPVTSVPQSPTAEEALALVESLAEGNPTALHTAVTTLLHEVFAPQIEEALTARANTEADKLIGGRDAEVARLKAELAKLGVQA